MIHFRKLIEADLEMVLHWRTMPEITKYMSTDIEFDMDAQRIWYHESVKIHCPAQHWVICHNSHPIGVIALADYDCESGQTSVSYYLGEVTSWSLGGIVPPYFYNYMFFRRAPHLKKILGEAFCLNEKVIRMHQIHGWTVTETLQKHVVKHGQGFDVSRLELTRENWVAQQVRYSSYLAEFEE